jgi:hypothetical protein
MFREFSIISEEKWGIGKRVLEKKPPFFGLAVEIHSLNS